MKKLALGLVAAAALGASACSVEVHGEDAIIREQKRIPVSAMPQLTIRSFDGTIEIRGWDRNEILVELERRASTEEDARSIKIDVTESEGDVLIEARPGQRNGFFEHFGRRSPRVRMLLTVPNQLNLEARTGDGAILARGLAGRVELSTGDGSVRVQDIQGRMTIRTGDGTVNANEVQGSVTVSTGDGSVFLSGQLDELEARTGDGAIDVDVRPGSVMKGDWRVSTGDGGVKILLPQDFNADIEATTGDGGISSTGIAVIRTIPDERERRRRGELRGRAGKGGEMLTVRTGDGPVDIHVR